MLHVVNVQQTKIKKRRKKMNRIEELEKTIRHHDKCYWKDNAPEIDDVEYDLLISELKELDPDNGELYRVHSVDIISSGKVVHTKPMLSLNKAYSLDDVYDWAKKSCRNGSELIKIQPKYDGISANYEGGVLSTRGDGEEGENITDKIELIELETETSIGPLSARTKSVRGEIIIKNDDFTNLYKDIKRKDGKSYKNSRNAVAGIMGLKDISSMKAQGAKVTLIDFDMVSWQIEAKHLKEDWPRILEHFKHSDYPMDGLVIKLVDEEYSLSLGNTTHHPRGQIAFKFSNVQKGSKLLGVEWSFGKNCLTPVALIEPTDIGGVTIQRATLHNVQNIIDMDLMIGDEVVVERAGDVIPYISSSKPGVERTTCLIGFCPCCGAGVKNRGPELYCTNVECPETLLQNLLASVKNIGIERLGEPNVRKMMETYDVKNLIDIFSLTVGQILNMPGFQGKSAMNLHTEIHKADKVMDWQLMASLNIPTVGKSIWKSILKKYTMEEVYVIFGNDDLESLDMIGEERAKAIADTLYEQSFYIKDLCHLLEIEDSKKSEDEVEKPTICFSGKMPEKRSVYEAMATERGYEPSKTVKGGLSLLVVMDPNSGSSKIKKAEKAGIKIIGLEDWQNA
jgi:DNA ligase (NAD+)